MTEEKRFYGTQEFANIMGEGWNRHKVHVYYKRGTIPQPFAYVGERPLWTIEQIEEYKSSYVAVKRKTNTKQEE